MTTRRWLLVAAASVIASTGCADDEVRRQKAAFLFNGELIDVCNDGPCTATPR